MKKENVKYGILVKYYPTLGENKYEIAHITSEVYEICGTECCKINIRSGVVAIENLEEIGDIVCTTAW